MSTPLPGSSEHMLRHSAPVEVPAAVSAKLAELAIDEPLPEVYGSDRVSLLVQSPQRIYLYWNFAADPFLTLRKAFGEQTAESYNVAVRLTDLQSGEEVTYDSSPFANNFWFNVRPGKSYRASVGLQAPGRPFLKLLASQVANTPRMTPSPFVDTTPEFEIPAIDFARALNNSGFVQAAIQVGLEAADFTRQTGSEGTLSEEWGQIEANVLSEEELSELQALLAAIASGADLSQLRATLSPRMLKILERILGTIDAARLRGLIGEMLGFEIEEDETKVLLSPVWGASDVYVPQRAFRVTAKSKKPGALSAPSSPSSSSISIKPQT